MDSLSTMPPQVLYEVPIVSRFAASNHPLGSCFICSYKGPQFLACLYCLEIPVAPIDPEMYTMLPSLHPKDSTDLHNIQDIEKIKREMYQFIK
jgi:hypothetical protein